MEQINANKFSSYEMMCLFKEICDLTKDDKKVLKTVLDSEMEELKQAVTNNDLIMVLDGIGDVLFSDILFSHATGNLVDREIGKSVANAMVHIALKHCYQISQTDIEYIVKAVSTSNLSKFDTNADDARKTIKKYESMGHKVGQRNKNGLIITYIIKSDDPDFIATKIMKSAVNYKPPCFAELIAKITKKALT